LNCDKLGASVLCNSVDSSEHDFIAFMLDGRLERMSYNRLQQLLGVDTSDRKLHHIVYGDALPPCRSRAGGTFPIDQEIRPLFMEPFAMAPCVH